MLHLYVAAVLLWSFNNLVCMLKFLNLNFVLLILLTGYQFPCFIVII